MARKLGEILQELPKERRELIESRADIFLEEVSNLEKLRKLRGLVQNDIARHLNIQQASVSKMERQTDMYISTLRNFVEACGGELELTVRFPDHKTPLRLKSLSDSWQETPLQNELPPESWISTSGVFYVQIHTGFATWYDSVKFSGPYYVPAR